MAQQVALAASEVDGLRKSIAGQVITPSDSTYDSLRRIWNGDIDRRPALIVRCTNQDDVKTALAFARKSGRPIAVRSGGHSVPGHSIVDDGIVIDLREMNQVVVDPSTQRATVAGGAVWAEVDGAAAPHGLAITGGHVSHTGVAALTLGGGIGHLQRTLGLTIDSLLSAQIVTADGQLVRASTSENEDLFWAIRGGGGNFGIATELEFQLHHIGQTVFAGLIFYPPAAGPDLMRLYNEVCQNAPDEVNTILAYLHAPPFPFVPEAVQFKPGYAVIVVATDQPKAELTIKPLREFGPPLFEMLAPMPYHSAVQTLFDPALPHGTRVYMKSQYLENYSDDVIKVVQENTARMPPGPSQILITQLGGALSRVPDDATAFGGRSAGFFAFIGGIWDEESGRDAAIRWVREFSDALEPLSLGGTYVNLADEVTGERLIASFGREKFSRLTRIKAKYDPENVFRLNQNIKPAK